MTTLALNNLWSYLKGLSLSQSDREWLANKLVMPANPSETAASEERKMNFLKLAGSWSDSAEGEAYYQMMAHRNENHLANREVKSLD